jgi:hypothetical protein
MKTRSLGLVASALAIFFAAAPAYAGKPAAPGAGADSCVRWRQDRAQRLPSSEGRAEMGWILGYVWSANTLYWPDGTLGQGMSPADIAAWVDDYCSRYPSESLAGASEALVTDMAHGALQRQTERLSQGETPRGDGQAQDGTAGVPSAHGNFSAMP